MSRYTSATDADRREMLDAHRRRLDRRAVRRRAGGRPARPPARPPAGQARAGGLRATCASWPRATSRAEDEITFLGAGMYDHYVPALIDSILSPLGVPDALHALPAGDLPGRAAGDVRVPDRDLRADRPAGLQRERLRGPERASPPPATWRKLHNKRTRFLISARRAPARRETLATTAAGWGTTIEEIPLRRRRHRRRRAGGALGDDVCAVVVQYPNFLGAVEDLQALADAAHEAGALVIVQADPLTLGVLKPPGEFGVDVAVGEGQTLGNRLDYGGPSLRLLRRRARPTCAACPGRIAGETTDVDGRRGFVLTLQTREQHIRREKATHNICTAQALNALAGVDLPELARPPRARRARRADAPAHRLRARALAALDGVELAARAAGRARVRGQARRAGRRGDRALRGRGRQPRLRRSRSDGLLVAITEQRSQAGHRPARRACSAPRWPPSARRCTA